LDVLKRKIEHLRSQLHRLEDRKDEAKQLEKVIDELDTVIAEYMKLRHRM